MDDILIVEDDRALSQGIRLGLEGEGRRFIQASTLAQGERALEERTFSLVVLDLNLPDGSGLELLRRLRARSALELGADDYVTKPFSLAVLRARVNNLLRRAHSRRTVLELPPFTFDFQEMTYTRNGVPLELSRTEQRLLRLLAEHRGQTLPRARLLEQVWDGGEFVDENALSVAVNRLRAKLTDAPIRTVYGVGYVWAVEP